MEHLVVDDQPASSLNLYFDKGRRNPNGLHAPRPWYEIEITSTRDERENKFYPQSDPKPRSDGSFGNSRQGRFAAYAEFEQKFYKINMVVCSDFGKAIASH